MIINRVKPDRGICFAWTPKWTPDGKVWLEWVHYERTIDAYEIHPWRYARFVPDKEYDAGKRREYRERRDCGQCGGWCGKCFEP